jgi:hypothetical protein
MDTTPDTPCTDNESIVDKKIAAISDKASRSYQQWVYNRLPLTAEQYRDLCCGLRAGAFDDDTETNVIDAGNIDNNKKRKR